MLLLLIVLLLFFTMSFRLKSGKYDIQWPITVLKYLLPIICTTFFGHIFLLLTSTFKCLMGKLYYAATIKCEIGLWYYITAPLSVLAMIDQIILSYITISIYYQADFIIEGNNLLKKRTSVPDIIFLINKIIVIIIFEFDKGEEKEHWGILFVICLLSGINAYATIFLQNYENSIIKKLHYFYSLFYFWGFISLLIGKIFKSWNFEGTFYLFILGLILIIIYCLFYAKTYLEFLHQDFNDMNSSQNCINYIRSYLKFIKEKEISRDSSMLITSFIEKMEVGCTNNNCILKKYLVSLSKGFDSNFMLLQFAQKLFKIALNKFPRDITLRIHYIVFLLTKVNQKKNAQKELFSIKPGFIFLDDNFKLYRCKKYLEEYNSMVNKEQEYIIESNDIFQAMEYKNNSIEFKKLLSKSSYLYYDFWSSLYSSHLQGTEDFKKLNDIGAELNQLIENIDKIFEKLLEIKNNDLVTIQLYESYVKNILNDKEKYEKYYNMSMNLITDNKVDNKEIDFTNFDLKIMDDSDEFKYLIVSANDENKGNIINMSLNSCSIFGYHRYEIIGKNMNILIPEIYHKIHNKLFNEVTEKNKTILFENLSKKIIYKPQFYEFPAFGRNKSKYLIPLDFKIFLVQTEESDLVYIVEFIRKNNIYTDLVEENENDKSQLFCILTDNNFIIQTFTSNCVESLGLNSKIINSNYDITNFIKQFKEELQAMISNNKDSGIDNSDIKSNENSMREINNSFSNNNSDRAFEHKLKLKKKLLKIKYFEPSKITWKMPKNNKPNSNIGKACTSLFSPLGNKESSENKNSEKKFIMEIKKAYIMGIHVGYYFYFKKIKLLNGINSNLDKNEVEKEKVYHSPLIKPKIKRPSVKFLNLEEESSKTSRVYNDDEEHASIVNKKSFKKIEQKKSSFSNFELDKKLKASNLRKHESATMLYNIYDEIDNVNEKFIPKSDFNFILDLESQSFKPSTKLKSCKELYDILKKQSIEKLNFLYKTRKKKEKKDKKDFSSSSSSDDDSSPEESNDSSYISSSPSDAESDEKISDKKTFKKRSSNRKFGIIDKNILSHKNITSNNGLKNNGYKNGLNYENEFYRVNLHKIKLMIYDFNQEVIITSENVDKKSKVETVIESYKSRQNINITEDGYYPNFSIDKFRKESKNRNYKMKDRKISRKNIIKEITTTKNIYDKEKEFEKEISYALAKQDEQKSIIYFYQVSFFIMIIILLMAILEIYYIIYQYKQLFENMKLVIHSANLKYTTCTSIYLIKENVLYSIDNSITDGLYETPDSNFTQYTANIFFYSQIMFSESNSIFESILGSTLDLCTETKYALKESPYSVEILYQNSKIKNVTSTLIVSIIQTFSALSNLLTKSDYISVDDPNLYNFLHNCFNKIGLAIKIQFELFVSELDIKEKHIFENIIIFCFAYLIVHILIYFIIFKRYYSIVIKKASYISVFYGIGLSLIKSSIKKCELFINKINNQNEDNIKARDMDEETTSLISSLNFNLNNTQMENNFKMNKKRIKPLKKSQQLGDDKRSKKFKLLFICYLIISFLYLSCVFFSFLLITNKFIENATYIYHMQNYHTNICELFNSYREFLFDENTKIYGKNAYDYLIEKEKEIYSTNNNDAIQLIYSSKYISDLNNNDFFDKGYCELYVCYFKSKEECINYMGGENGILSLGFDLLINSFIEDIRNAREYMKLLLDKQVLVGNLSEFIDIFDDDMTYGLDLNDTLMFRMKVFNMEQTHTRLNIIFINIILQYIIQERNNTFKAIEKSVTNEHIRYVLVLIVYIIVLLIIFLFYWLPLIKTLNLEIYKTKKMLTIIPLQILASHPNIKELLNISVKSD